MKRVVYRVNMDGAMLYEEHDTPQQAMEAASVYFASDLCNQRAEIIKYTAEPIGLVMRNNTKKSKI